MALLMKDLREMIAEQVQYRELLYQVTKRDLMLRYKQTVMGFGWAVFMPLVNTAVFSVIFTRVAQIDVGMPYPLYAFSGLVVWNFFASSLKFSITSLTSNTSLVTKVYFPREILPISAVFVSFVDFCVAFGVVVAMMVFYNTGFHLTFALLPIVVIAHLLFTGAIALTLSMWNLFYRDVKYIFEIVLTLWMFVTSVLYPTRLVGGSLSTLMQFNPMSPIVDAYRDVLIRGVVPPASFWVTFACTFIIFAFSWFRFHRSEFLFAESV